MGQADPGGIAGDPDDDNDGLLDVDEVAFDQLTSLLAKLDGAPQPKDWMVESSERDFLRGEIEGVKILLEFLL